MIKQRVCKDGNPSGSFDKGNGFHGRYFKTSDIAAAAIADVFVEGFGNGFDPSMFIKETCDVCTRNDTVCILCQKGFHSNWKSFFLQGSDHFFIAFIPAFAEFSSHF